MGGAYGEHPAASGVIRERGYSFGGSTTGAMGRRFASTLLVLWLCTACSAHEWRVSPADEPVGTGNDRSGVTVCPNGVEYRNEYGYGKGISDLKIWIAGHQIVIRFREHTFAGPTTKIREWIEVALP